MLRQNVESSSIRSMLASICLRRPKNAIDLPERTDRIHKVDFAVDESIHYNSMSAYVTGCLQDEIGPPLLGTYANVLTKINALRQICNLGTFYQGQLSGSVGLGNQGTAAQFLFEGMLSAGLAICTGCNSDLAKGDDSAASGINDSDATVVGEPRLSTCGELVCASCLPCLDGPTCQHQPSCKFATVDMSTFYAAPTCAPDSQLPVKMRALQKDLLAVPEGDKRYLLCTCMHTSEF